MEKRKMIISNLTVADYKIILEQIEKLGIQTYIKVIDQDTGYGVYTKLFTKAKHIPILKFSKPTPYKQKSLKEELKLCKSYAKDCNKKHKTKSLKGETQ